MKGRADGNGTRAPQDSWLKAGIACGNELHFRKQHRGRHNAINLSATTALLLIIATVVGSAARWQPWLYIPVAGVIVGICFFALYILIIHESSHNMFLLSEDSRRSRLWNRLSGWAIAIPFSTNYHCHWAVGHVTHHQHPLEPDDPQQENVLTGRPFLIRITLMLLVPGYVFIWNPSRKYPSGKWIPVASLLFWAILIGATASQLCWYAPLAFLFALQVLGTLNQFKGALEHGGAIGLEPHPLLRSRTSLFFGRRLLMPFNISLHFEHHLNFNVPWYLLPKYHLRLRQIVPPPLQPFVFNTKCWEQLLGRTHPIPPALLERGSKRRRPAA